MNGHAVDPLAPHREQLTKWASLWGVAGLEQRLEITFSGRFRSSLGRCAPARGEIRLAAYLLTGPTELLLEALCHEAAHAAAYALHGAQLRPHGPEWRVLMRAAQYEPRARLPASVLPPHFPQTARWSHRCPVCHASRVARRKMTGWRCAACRRVGLRGELVIARLDGGSTGTH
jgi:predicted SprT family Zn-dependent metalloprotease